MLIGILSLLLALSLILEGCAGPNDSIKKIDGLSPDERDAVIGLAMYNEGELTGKEHVVIKFVEGTSCRYRSEDPAATEMDAINEAKYWAKQQGAEAVKNLKCDPPRGKTLFRSCWESITCTVQAIKFAK